MWCSGSRGERLLFYHGTSYCYHLSYSGFALFTHTEYTFKVSHVNTLTGSIDKGKPKSISESMNHVRRTIVITVLHPENYTLLYIIVVLCRGQIVTDEVITAVPDRTGGVAEGK